MVNKNNKIIGNKTEQMLLDRLSKNGAWCHLFSYNANGQPCDVVTFKDGDGWLIDVKHCAGDRFYFKDIQPNQLSCFNYFVSCGNENCGFAIYFEKTDEFRWVSYVDVRRMIDLGYKSVFIYDCEAFL